MKVFSFEDPCGSTPGTDSSVDDPRLVATYPPAAGSLGNTPISVDPDTGIVYGSSTGSGSSVVHGFDLVPPPLYAVADSDDDGRLERLTEVIPLGVPNPGKREAVPDPGAPAAGHATYTPESFSVLAFLPGGELETGETIHVDVFATTVTGGRLPESAPGFPKSALRDLVLRRQSDDPSDAAYNRYQSDPIVVVADPRAQYAYARTVAENDPEKPDACRNCVPAADVAAKLRTQPAPDERLEILSGEKIRIRFSESLKASRPYLAEVDLERSALDLTSVRADLTPGLKQAPVLSGNSVLGVATHSREYSASAVDLSLAGRMLDLSIDRTYRSQVLHDGPLGRNQDSALFERLRPLPSGDVEYYDGMARRHTFAYEKDSASYDSPAGIASVLSKSSEGEYVLLHPDRSSTLFDATGRKRAYRDRHATAQSTTDGNRHLFEYDGEGRLASIVDDAGRRTRLVWDEGRLEQVKDFDGRTVDYTLVSARLETVTGPDPQDPSSERPVSRYTWGTASGDLRGRLFSSGRIETVSDGGTNAPATFTVGYAEDGAVSSVTTVDGTTGFTAPSASTVDVTDPKSATTTFTHQESGQVVKVKDAAGYETEFEYRGSVTKKGAPRADGLPWKTRLPEGQVIENTYGDLGDIDRIRHFNLTSTERRPKPGSSDAPLRTEISYDWRSLPTSVIRRDASTTPRPPLVTTIGRKSNGDVTSISEPGTASVGITTDNFGRPLVVGDSSGRSETRTYDDRPGYTGQLKSTTISGGETAPVSTVYERDARGNVLSTQDGAGRRVTYDVNKLDQTWRETRGGASPGVTSYRFDATGQVKEQDRVLFTPQGQEPDRSITGYVYDPLGRLKNRSASDSGTTTYGYDGQGNLKTVTTPQGTTT
ncbi:MAG TPA: DUF6531 domain-containing protein, partial [Thermoanaerobaculia bacterium]|nr:DUF6531 domain-containing protein [Thermoanaerobaculia bacterium]